MKKIVLLSCALIATQLAGMGDVSTVARINNNSSFDVKEVRFKVKINGKKYSIKIDEIKSGDQAAVDLANAAPDVNEIESIEILKIRPKYCISPDGKEKMCRARIHPTDGAKMNYIIVDEESGVMKPARPARVKGKKTKPAQPEEPRLVRVQY